MATRTWNGQPSPYWQHNEPICCPKKHTMGWLGSVYWLCSRCRTIYVQAAEKATKHGSAGKVTDIRRSAT